MTSAVLLDALGTLVRLDDPVGRLVRAYASRGVEVDPRRAGRAMKLEVAHYRAEHARASDRAGLEAVRDECAALVARELPTSLPLTEVRAALLEAIVFVPFDDAARVLQQWDLPLAIVSNWDVSLHDVLDELGWTARFGAVVTSAELGVAKPAPEPFLVALRALGVAPSRDVVHVGDDAEVDLAGAAAAGVRGVLIVREGEVPAGGVARLDELVL